MPTQPSNHPASVKLSEQVSSITANSNLSTTAPYTRKMPRPSFLHAASGKYRVRGIKGTGSFNSSNRDQRSSTLVDEDDSCSSSIASSIDDDVYQSDQQSTPHYSSVYTTNMVSVQTDFPIGKVGHLLSCPKRLPKLNVLNANTMPRYKQTSHSADTSSFSDPSVTTEDIAKPVIAHFRQDAAWTLSTQRSKSRIITASNDTHLESKEYCSVTSADSAIHLLPVTPLAPLAIPAIKDFALSVGFAEVDALYQSLQGNNVMNISGASIAGEVIGHTAEVNSQVIPRVEDDSETKSAVFKKTTTGSKKKKKKGGKKFSYPPSPVDESVDQASLSISANWTEEGEPSLDAPSPPNVTETTQVLPLSEDFIAVKEDIVPESVSISSDKDIGSPNPTSGFKLHWKRTTKDEHNYYRSRTELPHPDLKVSLDVDCCYLFTLYSKLRYKELIEALSFMLKHFYLESLWKRVEESTDRFTCVLTKVRPKLSMPQFELPGRMRNSIVFKGEYDAGIFSKGDVTPACSASEESSTDALPSLSQIASALYQPSESSMFYPSSLSSTQLVCCLISAEFHAHLLGESASDIVGLKYISHLRPDHAYVIAASSPPGSAEFSVNYQKMNFLVNSSCYAVVFAIGGPGLDGSAAFHNLRRNMEALGDGHLHFFPNSSKHSLAVSNMFFCGGYELVSRWMARMGGLPDTPLFAGSAYPEAHGHTARHITPPFRNMTISLMHSIHFQHLGRIVNKIIGEGLLVTGVRLVRHHDAHFSHFIPRYHGGHEDTGGAHKNSTCSISLPYTLVMSLHHPDAVDHWKKVLRSVYQPSTRTYRGKGDIYNEESDFMQEYGICGSNDMKRALMRYRTFFPNGQALTIFASRSVANQVEAAVNPSFSQFQKNPTHKLQRIPRYNSSISLGVLLFFDDACDTNQAEMPRGPRFDVSSIVGRWASQLIAIQEAAERGLGFVAMTMEWYSRDSLALILSPEHLDEMFSGIESESSGKFCWVMAFDTYATEWKNSISDPDCCIGITSVSELSKLIPRVFPHSFHSSNYQLESVQHSHRGRYEGSVRRY